MRRISLCFIYLIFSVIIITPLGFNIINLKSDLFTRSNLYIRSGSPSVNINTFTINFEDGNIAKASYISFANNCLSFFVFENESFESWGVWSLEMWYYDISNNLLISEIKDYPSSLFIDTNSDDVITFINVSEPTGRCIDFNPYQWFFHYGSVNWLKNNVNNFTEDYPLITWSGELPHFPSGIEVFSYTEPIEQSDSILWDIHQKRVTAQMHENGTANWNVNVTADIIYNFNLSIYENPPEGIASLKINVAIDNFTIHPIMLSSEYLGTPSDIEINNLSWAQTYAYLLYLWNTTIEDHQLLNIYELCEDAKILLNNATEIVNSTSIKLYGTEVMSIEYGETYLWNNSITRNVTTSQIRGFLPTDFEKVFFHNFIEFGGLRIDQDPEFKFYYKVPIVELPESEREIILGYDLILVIALLGIISIILTISRRKQLA